MTCVMPKLCSIVIQTNLNDIEKFTSLQPKLSIWFLQNSCINTIKENKCII